MSKSELNPAQANEVNCEYIETIGDEVICWAEVATQDGVKGFIKTSFPLASFTNIRLSKPTSDFVGREFIWNYDLNTVRERHWG